jgi:hypothetical protein
MVGSLRDLQAFFWLRAFSTSQAFSKPAPPPLTQTVIQADGREVKHLIHRHGLTEKEAFEIEAALIDLIGLLQLTNQVQGHDSDDRGQMTVTEIIAKYEAPEANIVEPVMLITVNRLYRRGMNASELYEITRGNWVVGTRRNKARYAFAVYHGIIREVYEIEEWFPAVAWRDEQKTKQRWRFTGKVAHHLKHYIGNSTTKYSVIGSQNPICYINS